MKSARAIKQHGKFTPGNIYNYSVDGYVIDVYLTNTDIKYFSAGHFFQYFIDVTTERKRKLKNLDESR